MFIVLVVLLVLFAAGGSFGYRRFGYAGMSPAGLLLIVLAVMYFGGFLHR